MSSDAAGTLVARAGGVRLQMAGVGHALEVRNDTGKPAYYACHGASGFDGQQDGAEILKSGLVSAGATEPVVSNAERPLMLTCRITDLDSGAATEALLGDGMNAYYVGHVISDGVQQ